MSSNSNIFNNSNIQRRKSINMENGYNINTNNSNGSINIKTNSNSVNGKTTNNSINGKTNSSYDYVNNKNNNRL